MNTVTYNFADGTKQRSSISKEAFFDERGRKRNTHEIRKVFLTTMSDLGAISFAVDADKVESTDNVKEQHFTAKERKQAKQDYKHLKSSKDFANRLQQFRSMIVDKFVNNHRKLRFNLVNLQTN